MFRPRDSEDQLLLDWSLHITPSPSELRSVRDPSGNVVTLARFDARASELCFRNRLVVSHRPVRPDARHIAPYARRWPFSYDLVDAADLWRLRERQFADPERAVDRWTREVVEREQRRGTLDMLAAVCAEIAGGFTYAAREEEGVQEPARTLALRTGTCRDFAVLMMEALRVMGFAARFVSGYVDPRHPVEHGGERGDPNRGGGATHAWVEAFVPGLGWTEFDPTNNIVGTRDLIRVASVGDWSQAVPLGGTWTGFPADALDMTVEVAVSREDRVADGAAAARLIPFEAGRNAAGAG